MNTNDTPNYHCRPDSEVSAKPRIQTIGEMMDELALLRAEVLAMSKDLAPIQPARNAHEWGKRTSLVAVERLTHLESLVSELLAILDAVEETDEGREFHPTTIQTCRCMTGKRLDEIFVQLKAHSDGECPR